MDGPEKHSAPSEACEREAAMLQIYRTVHGDHSKNKRKRRSIYYANDGDVSDVSIQSMSSSTSAQKSKQPPSRKKQKHNNNSVTDAKRPTVTQSAEEEESSVWDDEEQPLVGEMSPNSLTRMRRCMRYGGISAPTGFLDTHFMKPQPLLDILPREKLSVPQLLSDLGCVEAAPREVLNLQQLMSHLMPSTTERAETAALHMLKDDEPERSPLSSAEILESMLKEAEKNS